MVILEARQLGRCVDGKWVLRDISFALEEGECLAVMGPSGAGKSSLLRLLNKLDEPTEGTIILAGKDSHTIPPQELRRRVGMVMQAPHLFPGDIADNIRFGPRLQGRELTDEEVAKQLEAVGLSGMAGRSVEQLSGGEAARVSLARTLANTPEVLLLDEPTASLDEARSVEIEALIVALLQEHQMAAIWVTHSQKQAIRVSERMLHLEQGRLISETTQKRES